MRESKTIVALERPQTVPAARRYLDDFKRDAVRLVVEEKYSFKAAAEAVSVCEKTLRDWHKRFAPPPSAAKTPRSKSFGKKTRGCADSSGGRSWSVKS
jgi:transposase-like protein